MAVTPAWQAATVGSEANAGHINQFLGNHQSVFLYQGTVRSSQTTGTAVYSNTLTRWLAQTITTAAGQTAIGYVQLQLAAVGGSPTTNLIAPLTVSIYADSEGFPTGSALATTALSDSYVYMSPFWVTIPLPVSGLVPLTRYHIVTQIVGTTGHFYVWQQSNQTSGSATSTDGSVWVSNSYGLMYQVFDEGVSGLLQSIFEDSGARWREFSYNSNNQITQIVDYVIGQTSGGYLSAAHTLTYSGGLLTGVS